MSRQFQASSRLSTGTETNEYLDIIILDPLSRTKGFGPCDKTAL